MKTKKTVYEIITERITDLLSKGVVPWHKPWVGGVAPSNLKSKKPYRGINAMMLNCTGHSSNYFLTFKQAKEMGGSVRKGEHGFPVVFWKWMDREVEQADGTKKMRKVPMVRFYTVFNVDQIEGIEAPEVNAPDNFNPIEECEKVVKGYKKGPKIGNGVPQAFYRASDDSINMPSTKLFNTPEEYYSVLFHEMTHSTGHKDRLNRSTLTDAVMFGDTNYSKEELVAEMGASFLCGVTQIENRTINNSASYIQSWLAQLRNDSKLVLQAGAQAQKAVDHILGKEPVKA